MITIKLVTEINADKRTVFDLSRNINLHQESMKDSGEKAIAGKTSGLIELDETVTFKGKHFGFPLTHQSKITEMSFYNSFTDEMLQGHFKSFQHSHFFREENGRTIMTDEVHYEISFGILGRLFNRWILKNYLTRLLQKRNAFIKVSAEKHH
ncbi:hypothetical protein IP98_01827 [Flavobacterium cauense R2A-7]|uniref:Ligand-binding SRPBCC domain-containing protein n=1 Tax=Flavobacterium cauense R2A-7 TaxID=1341154 RepID=A0A562LX70_9FLAO|nr:SRPBCC family protein [Flavobacterium cauense]KGO82727.1 cell division protein [Flavobacterium cauense R2A-7]TWI12251.1 hypothetical protein IP98_01827 [Flavobacterium cauense R2A-7]